MAVRNPLWLQNKGYPSREDRQLITALYRGERVLGPTDLVVSALGGGSNNVSVAAGYTTVQGDSHVDDGHYLDWNDAAVTAVNIPDATNPRINRIVLEIDDQAEVGSGGNIGQITVVAGTPIAGASLTNPAHWPAVPATAIPLARVRVPTTGGVTSGDIVDERPLFAGRTILVPSPGFGIAGEIRVPSGNTDVIPAMFVPVGTFESVRLARVRYRIAAGTSATFKLQKNGVDLTGLTGLVATTTSGNTAPTNEERFADGDLIQPVVTAVSATPQNMSITPVWEHAV